MQYFSPSQEYFSGFDSYLSMMYRVINMLSIIFLVAFGFSCAEATEEEEQPRSSTYWLYRANFNPTSGEVLVTETPTGGLKFEISLVNTEPLISHPAHLHFGNVREVGELAYALTPVDGATGESVTILENVKMTNGDLLTYDRFIEMDGSIKVHMNDTYFKHMVLSYGNVGKNEAAFFDGVAVCVGH